jgi:hypothetical protein
VVDDQGPAEEEEDPPPPPIAPAPSPPRKDLPSGLSFIQQRFFHAQDKLRSYAQVLSLVTYPDPNAPDGVVPARLLLSEPKALSTCLRRTALGLFWEPGYQGGTDHYLCHDDVAKFEAMVVQHANQMNCITTAQAIDIAWFLKRARYLQASDLLNSIESFTLATQLRNTKVEPPDKTWIYKFAQTIGVDVMTPETLEAARRKSCNTVAISTFFQKYADALDRDPRLILNCDETHVSSRKYFKVLVQDGCRALKACREKLPHFSAMCTIGALGHAFRPMFILPEIKNFPDDLKNYADDAYFVSTGTGWMTQRTFLLYAHFLLFELISIRNDLPPHLQGERFLLILDGHSSRWTSEAIALLRNGGVDVLVLPAHCTHVLQPFDVCVASPLKMALARLCEHLSLSINEFNQLVVGTAIPQTMAEKRSFMINAFLSAWSQAADRKNIQSGFRTCGLFPLDPSIPLANRYTRQLDRMEIFPPPGDDPTGMNCSMVTEDDRLDILRAKPNRMFTRHPEKFEDERSQWRELIADPVVSGRLLSARGACHWHKGSLSSGPPGPWPAPPCHYFACQMTDVTPAKVWTVICRVIPNLPVLIVLDNQRELAHYSQYLTHSDIQHQIVIQRRAAEEFLPWYEFQVGVVDVCLGSSRALGNRIYARQIVVVFPRVPDVQLLVDTCPANLLIFYQVEAELEEARSKKIRIVTLQRSQYDPLEGLN